MNNRSNCIDRAWQILIFCIRIEKRLIDLLILKKHPRLIQKVNQSSAVKRLPYTFVVERTKLWKEDFSIIKSIFIQEFKPHISRLNNLEWIYDWRNMISHAHISLYRDYILYRPSWKRKKVNRLIKNHIVHRPDNAAKPFLMLLRLGDDKKYEEVLSLIHEFDQIYLKSIAENMGLNYEKIR